MANLAINPFLYFSSTARCQKHSCASARQNFSRAPRKDAVMSWPMDVGLALAIEWEDSSRSRVGRRSVRM